MKTELQHAVHNLTANQTAKKRGSWLAGVQAGVKRKVDEDRCGGVVSPVAPLGDSHNMCVCVHVRNTQMVSVTGVCQRSHHATLMKKGVFMIETGGFCWDFQHTDGRLRSFTLSESSFSTSFLIRRSMNGFRIMCSLESWSET